MFFKQRNAFFPQHFSRKPQAHGGFRDDTECVFSKKPHAAQWMPFVGPGYDAWTIGPLKPRQLSQKVALSATASQPSRRSRVSKRSPSGAVQMRLELGEPSAEIVRVEALAVAPCEL